MQTVANTTAKEATQPWQQDGRGVYQLDETGQTNRFFTYVNIGHVNVRSGVRTTEAEGESIARLMTAAPDLLAFLSLYRQYRNREFQLSELDRADDRLRESGI